MDIEVIEQKLDSLARCIDRIRAKCPHTLTELQKDIDVQDILTLNLTRAVQLAVDIAAHIVAHSNRPAPSTMGASFDVLFSLDVISEELAGRLKKAVGFRNIAVHNYEVINWEVVYKIATDRLVDFVAYVRAIYAWISERPN